MSRLFHFTAEEEQAITLAVAEAKVFMYDFGKPPKLPPPPPIAPILIEEETETENSNEEETEYENQIQEKER